ncbi:MAG: site-specific integrase [Devosia sp.]
MAKIPLTDLGVQRLPPGTYFDAKTPAFGIRVGKNRKTWIATKGKDRKVITLGHYPTISLFDARRKAYSAFIAPEQAKATIAFPDAKEAFLAQGKWRPASKRAIESSLRHFIWTKPLSKLTFEDIESALAAIPGRSARAHALKDIRAFLNWTVPRYLPVSPAVGIRMEAQPSRNRVLTDQELKAVWQATGECGRFGDLVKVLILTGQRRGEIGGLHGSMIDRDRLYFPPNLTKNGREHWVPLTDYSRSLLGEKTNRFVFPNENGDHFSAYAFNHAKLLKLSDTTGWTLHDLRRTFATGLAARAVPIHVTEKLLNHVSGSLSGVAAIYNRHSYWDEQVAAVKVWEERVLSICR